MFLARDGGNGRSPCGRPRRQPCALGSPFAGGAAAPEMFVSARGEPLSRWGFANLLKQHAATAARAHPGLDKKRISPHVLRHTCAMTILQATQDIRKVSLWLGHATLTTTEIYTRGDPTEKLDAMESIVHRICGAARSSRPTGRSRSSSALRNGEPDWRRRAQERDQVAANAPLLDLPIMHEL